MPLHVISDKNRYPHIPSDLILHIRELQQKKVKSRLLDALSEDPQSTSEAIDRMFMKASQITGQTHDAVLAGTDFFWQDAHPVRVDAAFAEVRTINILNSQGFSDIKQITGTSLPSADLIASRKGQRYALEVADSVYYASGRFSPDQMSDWIFERYHSQGKGVQLKNTASEFSCQRCVFVGIMDSASTVALQEAPEFKLSAETAWNRLGRDPTLDIAIYTGRVAAFRGPDDTVYPTWP